MSDGIRQDKRIAQLNTPLGKDKLAIAGFECSEGISEKFEIRIDAVSEDKAINFDSAIGQSCTITIKYIDEAERYFDGVLTEARWVGEEMDLQRYRLVLRPWLWLASFRRNCLIFHEMTVPDIVRKVLGEYGHTPVDKLSRGYPKLEYCVQYRESDMDFVCRLMEEYGISYYFQHADGSHELVMTDEMSTFHTLPGSHDYLPTAKPAGAPAAYFYSWIPERRFTSGTIKLDDYDFENSTTDLVVTKEVSPPFNPGNLEVFDYPGRYVKSSDGEKIAQAWRDAEQSNDGRYLANGLVTSVFPGGLITIKDLSDNGFDGEYLALRVVHRFNEQAFRSSNTAEVLPYEAHYELLKSDKTYAPPRLTPKGVIHGPQTAKVVGEGDIDVDKYGRILVRFHWDQKEDQSRRCRVAQVWAGNKWGGIYTPRVGMEVLVTFLDGDPDQPLIIGCVYNDKHMPPYELPTDKSISGVKSNSTPGGSGYNEFIFEDKDGSELVRLHAQKDLESVIENDESRTVKHDRETTIGNNDTLTVGQVLKIDAGSKIEIICGGSKITMTPDKIAIQSLQIDIQATDLKSNAVTSTHSAGALMDIKGALVKINS
jgi:type VI secretion system secreted protein VgrG